MALDGVNKVQLQQMLSEIGISQQNQDKAASIFDEVNKDSKIRHSDNDESILSGLEMQEFLKRTAPFLGGDVNVLREKFINTGVYAEGNTNNWREYNSTGDIITCKIDNNSDGVPDKIIEHRWSGERLLQTRIDADANKKFDTTIVYQYGQNGYIQNMVIYEGDSSTPSRIVPYEPHQNNVKNE